MLGVGSGGGGFGLGGQGGCERRIEVFVKIPKKKYFFFFWGGGPEGGGGSGWGGGVRVDVNEELKFYENSKKRLGGLGRGVGSGWGSGLGGQGGCERRIEVFVKIKKKMNTQIYPGRIYRVIGREAFTGAHICLGGARVLAHIVLVQCRIL